MRERYFGPTPAPMRRAKQSRARPSHNGDTVSEDRGGEREQTEREFHKQTVIRHSAGQV